LILFVSKKYMPPNINDLKDAIINQQPGGQTVDIAGSANQITPIQDMAKLIQTGAGAVFTIGGIAVLYFLLMGGFTWVTAGGDKGNVEKARSMITNAIIGIIILASVFAVYRLIITKLAVPNISVMGGSSQTGGGGSENGNGNNTGSCTPGKHYNAGSSGYCTGNTDVVCVKAGEGPSKFSYAHYEPCKCLSGEKMWEWQATCESK
jgi:hypothetical protein